MSRILYYAATIATILMASCTKNDNNENPVLPVYAAYTSMDDVYELLSVKGKSVTIDGTAGGTFYGNSGTRYLFEPNSFQKADGSAVTGIVQLETTEWLKKGDMIFSKMLPESDGESLFSGGELAVTAKYNGETIFLKPGKTFRANMPQGGVPEPGMIFFAGRSQTGNPNNNVNWRRTDSIPSRKIIYTPDTISIITDSIMICNADKYITGYESVDMNVTISAKDGSEIKTSTAIKSFAVYAGYNGMRPMDSNWGSSRTNDIIDARHVPVMPIYLTVFGLINNKFYGGILYVAAPNAGTHYSVVLEQVDAMAFRGQINVMTKK